MIPTSAPTDPELPNTSHTRRTRAYAHPVMQRKLGHATTPAAGSAPPDPYDHTRSAPHCVHAMCVD